VDDAAEGARNPPRLDNERAGTGLDHLVAHDGAHAATEDVEVLGLVTVGVDGGGERPRSDRVLDESEAPSGVLAPQDVAVAEAGEVGALALGGGYAVAGGVGHLVSPFVE